MKAPEELADEAYPKNRIEKASEQDLIEELQKRGQRVILEKRVGEGEVSIPEVADKDRFKFAVASDFHLASRYQQLGALRRFYSYSKKSKAQFVLCPGDLVEGSHKMHRDAAFYQFVHGADAQAEYATKVIPDVGLKTWAVSGNHDMSHFNDSGSNIVKRVAAERDDIEHAGDYGALIHMGPLSFYLWHPRGGTAYAKSYKSQKFIDELQPESRPHVLFAGHFHQANHTPQYGGVEAFLVPCFQSLTPYIKTLGKSPTVGGLILEVGLNDNGQLHRIRTEWVLTPASEWKRDDY